MQNWKTFLQLKIVCYLGNEAGSTVTFFSFKGGTSFSRLKDERHALEVEEKILLFRTVLKCSFRTEAMICNLLKQLKPGGSIASDSW